jgi:hypothetical protein
MFNALTSIYKNRFDDALRFIGEARTSLISFFPSLLEGSDTYTRSYEMMIKFQVSLAMVMHFVLLTCAAAGGDGRSCCVPSEQQS